MLSGREAQVASYWGVVVCSQGSVFPVALCFILSVDRQWIILQKAQSHNHTYQLWYWPQFLALTVGGKWPHSSRASVATTTCNFPCFQKQNPTWHPALLSGNTDCIHYVKDVYLKPPDSSQSVVILQLWCLVLFYQLAKPSNEKLGQLLSLLWKQPKTAK